MNIRLILLTAGIAALSAMTFSGTYSGGLGMEANPFRISTPGDWQELTSTPADWGAWFILANDIDFTGSHLSPIGNNTTRFTGTFEGNHRILKNLNILIPEQNYIGLFGYIGAVGKVRNLGIVNIDVHGRQAVGGLAGRNHGMILACFVSGFVRGEYWDVGGLVGSNIGGAVTECYAAVDVVSASDYAGGLVGYNDGDVVMASYATGSVSGLNFVGGFLGANDKGQVLHCYSTGATTGGTQVGGFAGVNWDGNISGCFWNIETSGAIANGIGSGKTTAQMQTLSMFVDAGWNFERVWFIIQGVGYPQLQWQYSAGDFLDPIGTGYEDFWVFSRCWLTVDQEECEFADLSGSGTVDIEDLLLFTGQWLQGR